MKASLLGFRFDPLGSGEPLKAFEQDDVVVKGEGQELTLDGYVLYFRASQKSPLELI